MELTNDATAVPTQIDLNTLAPDVRPAHTGKPGPWKEGGVLRGGPKGKPGKYDHLSFKELQDLNRSDSTDNAARQETTRRERLMKLEPVAMSDEELARHRDEIETIVKRAIETNTRGNSGPMAYGIYMREWQKRGLTSPQARTMINTNMMFSG